MVVRQIENDFYCVSFAIRESVKPFYPPLPYPPVFPSALLSTFMLAKMINGEREAIRSAPSFKTNSLIQEQLLSIYRTFPISSTPKKILSTSFLENLKSALLTNPHFESKESEVWQKRPVFTIPSEITCSDAWGNKIIIGTKDGLFIYNRAKLRSSSTSETCKLYKVKLPQLDEKKKKAYHFKRITVIDALQILVALVVKVGIIIYDLASLLKSKTGPIEFRLSDTKNAYLYALGTIDNTLCLCICSRNRLVLYKWLGDTFKSTPIAVKMEDKVYVVEFLDKRLIIGFSSNVSIIDLESVTIELLYSLDSSVKHMDIVALENEYLLLFNNRGVFIDLNGNKTRNYDIHFSTVPNAFVMVHPYILAFSPQSIEVRTSLNGNLIQSILPEQHISGLRFLTSNSGIFWCTYCTNGEQCTSILYQLRIQGVLVENVHVNKLQKRTKSVSTTNLIAKLNSEQFSSGEKVDTTKVNFSYRAHRKGKSSSEHVILSSKDEEPKKKRKKKTFSESTFSPRAKRKTHE
eukprot:TRINITY_DN5735_c0_g1_i1.p1 TRINITY_DN5735_c0_g1~~TRINITY_DN5735_c0_g1_i1.p1  ORF type:complete len:519 (+),score=57.39 TRINITY_DN5735_c0_g1_i1:94-1650(+)